MLGSSWTAGGRGAPHPKLAAGNTAADRRAVQKAPKDSGAGGMGPTEVRWWSTAGELFGISESPDSLTPRCQVAGPSAPASVWDCGL